ncbi:(2Fe-2S)-binding protein [Skermanella sp. TT6]|uniref:(2Fe-2S)-binding protein n=1 Tax=Skermanella cutis TaxID=2775420 RepID=A0ABX7B9X4_9PROT|nr:(2Fe-2S)-binding protein [Skermanella sp. TT6]QQP91177.1 (2Fe-2S)-binding protein [Skermanella sp. TT6]
MTLILNCSNHWSIIGWVQTIMYVCICHGFTEKKVKQALTDGVCSAAGFFTCMGCKPQCGKCVPYVRQMVTDHRNTLACANTCSASVPEEAAIAAE